MTHFPLCDLLHICTLDTLGVKVDSPKKLDHRDLLSAKSRSRRAKIAILANWVLTTCFLLSDLLHIYTLDTLGVKVGSPKKLGHRDLLSVKK